MTRAHVNMKHQIGRMKPRAALGLALIVLALLLFLHNLGFRVLGAVLGHWPLVFLALGAYLQVAAKRDGKKRYGVLPYVLLALGGLGLLSRYGIWHFGLGALIGPAILLGIGVYLFKPQRQNPDAQAARARELPDFGPMPDAEGDTAAAPGGHSTADTAKIDVFAILGGGDYVTRAANLKGGSILCIMGAADVDIRDADTQQDEIEIDIITFMGGAEIRVPPHWEVTVKAFPLLGGLSNKTTCLADKMGLPKKRLVITGLAVMGGIDIRN